MPTDILIVEDDRVSRNLLKIILEDVGHEIREASNGEEALKMITKKIPDLLLLDLMMPKMDGWTVCNHLRANEMTRDLKVIIITAKRTNEDMEKAKQYKVAGYLVKPFQVKSLEQKIASFLNP